MEFKYYAIFTHFLNIKPIKGTFCTNNKKSLKKNTDFNLDRKRLTSDGYIFFDVQRSYNRMRFYIYQILGNPIVTGHLHNGSFK